MRQSNPWITPWLLFLATLLLGIGLSLADQNAATIMAVACLLLTGWALVERTHRPLRGLTQRSMVVLGTTAVVAEAIVILVASPLRDVAVLAAPCLAAVLLLVASRSVRLRTAAVLAAVALQAAWLVTLIGAAVPANMDVYMFQQEAAAAALGGANPYELRYPNIYGPGTPFYSPAVVENGFLTFGFPYPPLSLALVVPPYVVAGDYRYGLAAAVVITALIVALIRPGPVGPLMAGTYLLSPMTLRVVVNGWTEPFLGLFAALVAVAAVRRLNVLPIVLGLLVALKQYVFPIVIVAAALLPRTRTLPRHMTALIALAVAAVTVIPALILEPAGFVYSVGLVQLLQPFRHDSVSIPGLIARLGGPEVPALVAIITMFVTAAALAMYSRRTPVSFAAASAILFMAFFLMSKQAFLNYYFFVFTLIALAAVLSSPKRTPADEAGAN